MTEVALLEEADWIRLPGTDIINFFDLTRLIGMPRNIIEVEDIHSKLGWGPMRNGDPNESHRR